jgi:hypothetical protein
MRRGGLRRISPNCRTYCGSRNHIREIDKLAASRRPGLWLPCLLCTSSLRPVAANAIYLQIKKELDPRFLVFSASRMSLRERTRPKIAGSSPHLRSRLGSGKYIGRLEMGD